MKKRKLKPRIERFVELGAVIALIIFANEMNVLDSSLIIISLIVILIIENTKNILKEFKPQYKRRKNRVKKMK